MSDLRIDEAAVRWSVGGALTHAQDALDALAERPLLVLMHGYGSFEGDLIELAPHLPHDFVCASPRAPLVAPPPIVNGYSWFPIPLGPDGLPAPLPIGGAFVGSAPHLAAEATLAWLDALSERVAGGLGDVALMGFSQGGAMVTSLLRLRPERFFCGVNCSGFVAPGAFPGDDRLAEVRPPVFWGRDEADPIVRSDRIELTTSWLPRHSELEAHLYPGIAHSISREELDDISAFLGRHLAERARP